MEIEVKQFHHYQTSVHGKKETSNETGIVGRLQTGRISSGLFVKFMWMKLDGCIRNVLSGRHTRRAGPESSFGEGQ